MPSNSYIQATPGAGMTFVGHDAVALYRAMALVSGLKLLRVGIRPHRTLTATRALTLASDITGKPYKRYQYDAAITDLQAWISAMRAAVPLVTTSP